jgi:hypothetical protein
MTKYQPLARVASLLAGSLAIAALLRSQTLPEPGEAYGPGDQVLVVGSSAFRAVEQALPGRMDNLDGYVYPGAGAASDYSAPVTLPEGARIVMVCLYAYDGDPGASVVSEMHAFKLAPAGAPAGRIQVPGTYISSYWDYGYGVVCSNPLSFTYLTTGDIDGDGTAENVAYRVAVSLGGSQVNGFGGVRIFWHRTVSPPPATASFNDVPTTDLAFQFVEALAASGITAGCGGGNYCPDAPLTRRQMAVFLAKALGLHWQN